jgi:hypothetical protein
MNIGVAMGANDDHTLHNTRICYLNHIFSVKRLVVTTGVQRI